MVFWATRVRRGALCAVRWAAAQLTALGLLVVELRRIRVIRDLLRLLAEVEVLVDAALCNRA